MNYKASSHYVAGYAIEEREWPTLDVDFVIRPRKGETIKIEFDRWTRKLWSYRVYTVETRRFYGEVAHKLNRELSKKEQSICHELFLVYMGAKKAPWEARK